MYVFTVMDYFTYFCTIIQTSKILLNSKERSQKSICIPYCILYHRLYIHYIYTSSHPCILSYMQINNETYTTHHTISIIGCHVNSFCLLQLYPTNGQQFSAANKNQPIYLISSCLDFVIIIDWVIIQSFSVVCSLGITSNSFPSF